MRDDRFARTKDEGRKLKKDKKSPRHIGIIIDDLSVANKTNIHKTTENIIEFLETIYPLNDIKQLTFCHKNQKGLSGYFRKYLKKKILSDPKNVNLLTDTDEIITFEFKRPKNKDALICGVTFNYSGRKEITNSIKKILSREKTPRSINEARISQNLSIRDRDVDLLICCAEEFCLNDFLLWQSAYGEIWRTPKTWLGFSKKDLEQALADFQKRNRRFGSI
jgi:undecaprenyl diphosphate synthase